jgi:hypothetical protein
VNPAKSLKRLKKVELAVGVDLKIKRWVKFAGYQIVIGCEFDRLVCKN